MRKGGDLPTLEKRGGACRSQTCNSALLYFMRAQASAETNAGGEPVSRRPTRPWRLEAEGPLCTLILVAKASSSVVGNAAREARSMFGDRGGGVSEGSSPSVTVETKVRGAVEFGWKGGRKWFSTELPAGSAMVRLISWISLSESETQMGLDGGGCWSSWRRIFMRTSPKGLSSRHC